MKKIIIILLLLLLICQAFFSSCKNYEENMGSTEGVAESETERVTEPVFTQVSVTIDNFVDRNYDEDLCKELADGYYNVNFEFKHSVEPKNTVTAQSIPSGIIKKVTVNNPESYIDITLTVSNGTKIYTLPDYSGQRKEDVISDLRSKNLTVNVDDIVTVYSDEYEAGEVISTEPAAGTEVSMRDTVKLTVSYGAEIRSYTVPDFTNMTRIDVENALRDVDFKKVEYVEEYSDTVEKGQVIEQSHPPKTELIPETSKFVITISMGNDPQK